MDGYISYTEIKQAVFPQNNNKSSGLDNLTAELLKYSVDKISTLLLLLFNRIYSWGEGITTPAFKHSKLLWYYNYKYHSKNIFSSVTKQTNQMVDRKRENNT